MATESFASEAPINNTYVDKCLNFVFRTLKENFVREKFVFTSFSYFIRFQMENHHTSKYVLMVKMYFAFIREIISPHRPMRDG